MTADAERSDRARGQFSRSRRARPADAGPRATNFMLPCTGMERGRRTVQCTRVDAAGFARVTFLCVFGSARTSTEDSASPAQQSALSMPHRSKPSSFSTASSLSSRATDFFHLGSALPAKHTSDVMMVDGSHGCPCLLLPSECQSFTAGIDGEAYQVAEQFEESASCCGANYDLILRPLDLRQTLSISWRGQPSKPPS